MFEEIGEGVERRKVINDVKLEYLCRNKLPGIIFVWMHGDDYVISRVVNQTGSSALIDEKVS